MLKRKAPKSGPKPGKTESKSRTPDDRPAMPPLGSPGTLRGKARLVIQTRQAQRLIGGRPYSAEKKRRPIPGLFTFASALNRIWEAASLDDPYADWYLLRIADDLETTHGKLQALLKTTRDRLLRTGVEIQEAKTRYPVSYVLHFRTPYAFMAAYLVADFDTLARIVLTAEHVGTMSRQYGEQILNEGARHVRRTLQVPATWKSCRITRHDLLMGTEAAAEALRVMGKPPPQVIDGTWRAIHAPTIRRPTTDQAAGPRDSGEGVTP